MNQPVAIVTGASSGIGLATAQLLSRKGYTVYGINRGACEREGIRYLQADTSVREQLEAAVSHVLAEQGRIDLLVNNAGFGISGSVEFTEPDEAKKMFDVNLWGYLNCIQCVLPAMRAQRSGRIVNISSVAGLVSIPFQGFYSCTKYAVQAMTLALREEVRPYGIKVCAVLPGDVQTSFTERRRKNPAGSEIYPAMEASIAGMERDERGGLSPDCVAGTVWKTVRKRNPKPLTVSGTSYRLLSVLIKLLPLRFVNWMIGKLYAKNGKAKP